MVVVSHDLDGVDFPAKNCLGYPSSRLSLILRWLTQTAPITSWLTQVIPNFPTSNANISYHINTD